MSNQHEELLAKNVDVLQKRLHLSHQPLGSPVNRDFRQFHHSRHLSRDLFPDFSWFPLRHEGWRERWRERSTLSLRTPALCTKAFPDIYGRDERFFAHPYFFAALASWLDKISCWFLFRLKIISYLCTCICLLRPWCPLSRKDPMGGALHCGISDTVRFVFGDLNVGNSILYQRQ